MSEQLAFVKQQVTWAQEDAHDQRRQGNGAGDGSPITVYDAGDIDAAKILPREWLLGLSFCRKFISGLIAEGGGGKTAIRYAQYLALASGKPITGEHVHHRGRVLIVCLEDDLDEVRRRIGAAMLHHNISPDQIKGWLYYCTPKGLKLLEIGMKGERAAGQLQTELMGQIAKLTIDLVAIDPFVKAHGVEENDNGAIDEVCVVLSHIGEEGNCAVDIVHHARKGSAQPGDADRSRGASSMISAGRLMRTITPMAAEEAGVFGIPPTDRPHFIRVDDAKINLAARSTEAMWFKLVGVPLGNGTDAYPSGDNVQTVERWTPPDLWDASADTLNAILDEIDAGLADERLYSHQGAAKERAAWPVVLKHLDRTEEQARKMIKTWVETGVLTIVDYEDQKERKPRQGLKSDPNKRLR